MESKKTKFIFKVGSRIYSLEWTDLLTLEEVLFESSEDLTEGTRILAPWFNGNPSDIQYAEAVVTNKK